jgi:hypothetical protein
MLGNAGSGLKASEVSVKLVPMGLDERSYGSQFTGEASDLRAPTRLPAADPDPDSFARDYADWVGFPSRGVATGIQARHTHGEGSPLLSVPPDACFEFIERNHAIHIAGDAATFSKLIGSPRKHRAGDVIASLLTVFTHGKPLGQFWIPSLDSAGAGG